jgi:hypothetical protein
MDRRGNQRNLDRTGYQRTRWKKQTIRGTGWTRQIVRRTGGQMSKWTVEATRGTGGPEQLTRGTIRKKKRPEEC